MRRTPVLAVLVVFLATGVACGPPLNLGTALAVTDVFSGYYDNGIKDGTNHMVPSVTFRLKNLSDQAIGNVQLTLDFWLEGGDGPLDSALIRGIGSDAVEPGALSDPITVRSGTGFKLEGARADLFIHSLFKDASVKIFAKRSGTIAPLGEFKIERRILPHVPGTFRP